MSKHELWLAPLRGVTIRAFREAFAPAIREAGFAGAFAPFIPANPGIRVNDRMLADLMPFPSCQSPITNQQNDKELGTRNKELGTRNKELGTRNKELGTRNKELGTRNKELGTKIIPQVITKDPASMRELLKGFKDRGFDRADLNSGCPFPMIRRRRRGSGLMKSPDVLERLLEAGCDEMGAGKFSLKIRLGLERADELLALMPMINRYPLAVLTVHARTAKQMYEGGCDRVRFDEVAAASVNPVMYNGDVPFPLRGDEPPGALMIGRSFVRALGARDDASELLRNYISISQAELCGDRPVLGRMKELLAYWCDEPKWRRLWSSVKICRTVDELLCVVGLHM